MTPKKIPEKVQTIAAPVTFALGTTGRSLRSANLGHQKTSALASEELCSRPRRRGTGENSDSWLDF